MLDGEAAIARSINVQTIVVAVVLVNMAFVNAREDMQGVIVVKVQSQHLTKFQCQLTFE